LTSGDFRVLFLSMQSATDMAETHAAVLGQLAQFGLDLARKLHGQGMAAETPEETAELAKAFHSVARTVRQTLALEARLMRDAKRQEREDRTEAEGRQRLEADAAEQAAHAPYAARKSRIVSVIDRILATEYEDEAERLSDEIADRLGEDARDAGFLDQPIDEQIAGLCRDFGLPPPARPIVRPAPASAANATGPP
jgi:ribosomal protein S9